MASILSNISHDRRICHDRSGWTRPAPVRAKQLAGCTDLAALDVATCPKRHRANARARHLPSAIARGRSACSPRYRQPGRCIVRVRFAAVWPRQHRAVVLGALIPAVCLACRIPRMALLDRRLDLPAAFAIWLVSHAGCSLLPPARPPAYWERRRRSVISLCHWLPPIGISSPKRWRKTSIVPTSPSGASEQTKARPGSRKPGRAFDLPVHPRSGRSEQNKRRDAGLHLDKSMLETSRPVTSLGSGMPMTDPRGQWRYHRRHAYRDALPCPGGQGPAQGHQNPRRHRRGGEVPRL